MTHSSSNDRRLKAVAAEELRDDNGDVIGTRASVIADGLHASLGDGLESALAILTPHEISEIVANRVLIERAKGMLMAIYRVDADEAFELLKYRSQVSNMKVRLLAKQLAVDLVTIPRADGADLRSWCDSIFLTVHERVRSTEDASLAMPRARAIPEIED